MGRIGFGMALMLVALHAGFDARAENLTLEGTVSHVRDGDTIELGPIAIRLEGIAAPELNEPGGALAADAMRDLVLEKDLRCDLTGDRSHDRVIGVCFLDDGRDSGATRATATGSAEGVTRMLNGTPVQWSTICRGSIGCPNTASEPPRTRP